MKDYKIQIASYEDEEEVVAEIWFDFHFATIFHREEGLKIEFNVYHQSMAVFDLDTILEAIAVAKSELVGER